MEPSHALPAKVRFGVFEADLAGKELRKRGRKVPLQDQPFQVLALLLRHPGEIVTREDLQRGLWPADTFVEFEHGVNTAIKKLRQALGDSADNPRFIETLPRKGYRFIAPVAGTEASTPTPARRGSWIFIPAAAVVLAGVAYALWFYNRTRIPDKLSAPVLVTGYLGSKSMPSFSPDGQRIAFTWDGPKQDNSDIYVTQIGEGEPVRLTTDPAIDYAPAWSPDGRSIAFLRRGGVFLVPAIGGPARKIAEVRARLYKNRLSWHPGGKWLVAGDWASETEPQVLIAVSTETGEKRTLTVPPRTGVEGDYDPAVSPDGRSVVFVRRISSNESDLYLLELSKEVLPIPKPRRLITTKSFNAEPSWSADGRSILFVSGDTAHHPSLWRMALSGSSGPEASPERLPFEDAQWPTISRQGRLVYARRPWDFDVWRLELNGTRKMERMSMNSSRLDHTPRYSPDGSRIAFASDRSGSHEIWTCNADGSNAAKLTSFGGPYVAGPAWSPDGRRIAFVVQADATITVYLIGSEGGTPVELLRRDWDAGMGPSWSANGKWIYFGGMDSGMQQIFRIPASGGEPKRITNNGGTTGIESPDGEYVYYRKDSDPGLWKVPATGGEETRVLVSMLPQAFDVTKRGVYFFSSYYNPAIQFLNFATGRVETIADLQLPGKSAVSYVLGWGLSVSRDDRSLLYVQREDRGIDLMLVENFR